MPHVDQSQFDLRCDWGLAGLQNLAESDAIVIVDVLSFTTCVEVALSRGATILPYQWKDDSAAAYACAQNAELAGSRRDPSFKYSLSPASLMHAAPGLRLVLPSPNGSTLALAAKCHAAHVFAACLRNARAVAAAAASVGNKISVIPAGERWLDGSIRFAIEDLIGTGAVLSTLPGRPSPESESAIAVFHRFKSHLKQALLSCASGRELVEAGFAQDVQIASELDVSQITPILKGHEFVNYQIGSQPAVCP
jgi:2-phosphosulfolactate phosphatase